MAVEAKLDYLFKVAESLSTENKQGAIQNTIKGLITLTNGTGSGQADLVFSDRRTLAASANEVLDLAGSLTDSFGATITFAKIKFVLISNRSSTDGDDLEAGPDSTNGWAGAFSDASDRVTIPAGGLWVWYDPNGQAVSAGSTDELYVAETGGSNSVDYDVLIIGTSA